MKPTFVLLFAILFAMPQTERFEKCFTVSRWSKIYLVPVSDTYPTGALLLYPHPKKRCIFYRDEVAWGTWNIYINISGDSLAFKPAKPNIDSVLIGPYNVNPLN